MSSQVSASAGHSYSLQSIVPTLPKALQDSAGPDANQTDEFLKLMVAQIQNQDPDKPVDGTALISQMTQMQSAFAVQRQSFLTQATQQITTSAALIGRLVTLSDPTTGAPISGKVTSVDYTQKDPQITVGNTNYPLTAVQRVDA